MALIEAWLLEIMRCPRCGATLTEDEPGSTLICDGCGSVYPVVDGIPDMVIDG